MEPRISCSIPLVEVVLVENAVVDLLLDRQFQDAAHDFHVAVLVLFVNLTQPLPDVARRRYHFCRLRAHTLTHALDHLTKELDRRVGARNVYDGDNRGFEGGGF